MSKYEKYLTTLTEENGKDHVVYWKDDGEDMEVTLNSICSRFETMWWIKDLPSVPKSEYSYKDSWSSKEQAITQAKKLVKEFYK